MERILVNNTMKHANATEVRLAIYDHGDMVEITYSDNGSGFDMDKANATGGLGLENIRNRCKSIDADLVMESGKGKGFKMVMTIKKNNN
jgi:signal transduction histidine kinase